jgi:tRNA modification GTPase
VSSPIDTIVAPATPVGRSALAIVRIDGPLSDSILLALSGHALPPERLASLRRLHVNGVLLDEAVAIRYVGPRSFTGNDLVELTLHGNPLLIEQLLQAVVARGARLAEPGEFTERAVLNGKLDLVQAEAVADLIAARTPLQARLSLTNLSGALSREAATIRTTLLDVMSRLEAALDFSEEGYEFISRDEALSLIEQADSALRRLHDSYERGRATTAGVNLVILGRPNAGKSTLLNELVGTERAIVTPIAGTTRDIVRETVVIGGLPVSIADTAGLRSSDDVVEGIGIAKARDAAAKSDIVSYLVSAPSGMTLEDRAELSRLDGSELLVIYTKVDLAAAPAGELGISAASGEGMSELWARLDALVRERFAAPESSGSLVNARQREIVNAAMAGLAEARQSLLTHLDEQMVLVDLQRVAGVLGSLTGVISRDDVYSEIFSRFCIGK